MKTTILLICSILATSFAFAQDLKSHEVPTAVQTAFAKAYPAVTKAKWEKENENYEVEFELDEVETSVVFDASGILLETETELEKEAVPSSILSYIQTNYSGKKIKEAAKIQKADGTILYEVEINNQDVMFDSKGAFLYVSK